VSDPITRAVEALDKALNGKDYDETQPPKYGFVVVVLEFGRPIGDNATAISNLMATDVPPLLRNAIKQLDQPVMH